MNTVEQMAPYVAEKYSAAKIVDEVMAQADKLQLLRHAAHGNFRENIVEIEKMLTETPGAFFGDTENCPLTHTFANGIYLRQIFIPATTLYVSRIHKFDHHRIILSGELTTVDEYHGLQRLHAPMSMICRAGTKRVGYAHTDCIIATLHRTEETDPEKLRKTLFVDTYTELEMFLSQPKEIQ